MATYDTLSQSSKDAIDELLVLARPMAAEIYKFAQENRVLVQHWFTNPPGEGSTLADIVNTINSGTIPNKTGLAGADAVTAAGLQSLMSYVQTIAGHDTNSHLNVLLPFAGSSNF